MLIRVGGTVINLDSVMMVDLDYHPRDEADGEPQVVFEFRMRGSDELDRGENWAYPYLKFFEGEEAEAIRRFFKQTCPDLLDADQQQAAPGQRAFTVRTKEVQREVREIAVNREMQKLNALPVTKKPGKATIQDDVARTLEHFDK